MPYYGLFRAKNSDVYKRQQSLFGDRILPTDEVPETQEVETEDVARSGIDRAQEAGRTERSRERERCALGDLQVSRDLGDPESRTSGIPDKVEQSCGAGH